MSEPVVLSAGQESWFPLVLSAGRRLAVRVLQQAPPYRVLPPLVGGGGRCIYVSVDAHQFLPQSCDNNLVVIVLDSSDPQLHVTGSHVQPDPKCKVHLRAGVS